MSDCVVVFLRTAWQWDGEVPTSQCQTVRFPSVACCVVVGGTTATLTRAILYVMKPRMPVSTCRICIAHTTYMSASFPSGQPTQGACQVSPCLRRQYGRCAA